MNPTALRSLAACLLVWLPVLATLVSCASAPVSSPTPHAAAAAAADPETQRLHALFEQAWDAKMRRRPGWATYIGDNRFGDRLEDASPDAEAAEYADARRFLAAAQSFRRDALSTKDRSSLDIFIYRLQDDLRFEPLVGFRRMTLGAIGGFHFDFAGLLDASPVAKVAEVEQMLTRLAAYPKRVDQEIVRLREGQSLGWVPPREVLERVLKTLDDQIGAAGDTSPFFLPFTRLGPDISAAEREALRERGRRVVAEQVVPAQRRLREFVAGDYLRAAPASGALSGYPGGAAVYAAAVRSQTTTELSPAQVHAIGLREVARLRGEIAKVMKDMQWQGDFASFVRELNTDPKYFHPSPEALLTAYRDIAKRIDAELPRLFAELPRATYGVRAMPAYAGPDQAEYYDSASLDGSRPGWFNANTKGYRTRPKWGQETLTAHEAVPGHHLQTARAIEMGELPSFRKFEWFVAYGEGWALYAETLGFDLGLYKEPASHFGHLQEQMLRAARLVVDTGIHAEGWSRQRAIDYLVAEVGMDRGFLESEADRYTSDPGQALGYMIGELKIIALRDRARARLGERFDIRRFHMAVIDTGAVPLQVLDRLVDEWIAAELVRR
jgi:uncharacterized protein (DUF885 family)